MIQKIPCIKCGTKFKDRDDDHDTSYEKQCCWKCRSILQFLALTIRAMDAKGDLNRKITLNLDAVHITVKKKGFYQKGDKKTKA